MQGALVAILRPKLGSMVTFVLLSPKSQKEDNIVYYEHHIIDVNNQYERPDLTFLEGGLAVVVKLGVKKNQCTFSNTVLEKVPKHCIALHKLRH